MYTNRPYQNDQLAAIESNYTRNIYQQVISAATGTGKTVVFAQIPEHMKKHLPGQMLVLSHTDELLDQSIDKIQKANPKLTVSKEKASTYADTDSDIIVASVASLGRKGTKRIKRFDWDKIDKLVTDECHHSTATSYLNIYEEARVLPEHGTNKLHVGFTATPQRADGKALAKIFKSIVHEYALRQAITDGWLVDVKGIKVHTTDSLDHIKTVMGDFSKEELASTVNNPIRNRLAVNSWMEHAKGRQTLVFCVDIKHAQDMANEFSAHGIKCEAIWGSDPDRETKLNLLREGKLDVICNCNVLTEGFDYWGISCIILARPTKSGVLYTQMIGRGTRLEEGIGNLKTLVIEPEASYKQDCIVIDLVDNSSKHSLVTLPTLMGLNSRLDLKGHSLVGSIKEIEEAQEEYSHISFDGLTDIDSLGSYIESVDLFNVKPIPEVDDNSELVWHPNVSGGYILILPNKLGEVKLAQNLLDKWELHANIADKKYRGEREDIREAFNAADGLIMREIGDSIKLVKKGQRWHGDPATTAQLKLLAKLFKGKPLPKTLSKGEASVLIGRQLAKK